jgi:hypothetical protein
MVDLTISATNSTNSSIGSALAPAETALKISFGGFIAGTNALPIELLVLLVADMLRNSLQSYGHIKRRYYEDKDEGTRGSF